MIEMARTGTTSAPLRSDQTRPLSASVVVPTYNRSQFVARVLDGLAAQEVRADAFEVIVVDNNSSDDTRSVCEESARRHPAMQFRYLLEAHQGLANARNRGIGEARGEFVCILDDDAAPTPGWLKAFLEVFADAKAGCLGGPAIPDYLGQERPPWLRGDLQGLIGGYWLPYRVPTAVSTRYGSPIGGNLAIRKSVLDKVGLFRSDLDPAGNTRILEGENELIARVTRAGWSVLYVPGAVVRHFVSPNKLSKSYLYEEGRRLAASHVLITSNPNPFHVGRFFASDLWFAMRLLVRYVVARLRGKELWFDDYMRFWIIAQRLVIRAGALIHNCYSRAGILARVTETRY